MTKPHIHAEPIKAWADGAEIESCFHNNWTLVVNPSWSADVTYRVKPKPTAPIVQWINVNEEGFVSHGFQYRSQALKIARQDGHSLMRLEIDPVTFTATCVMEDV